MLAVCIVIENSDISTEEPVPIDIEMEDMDIEMEDIDIEMEDTTPTSMMVPTSSKY